MAQRDHIGLLAALLKGNHNAVTRYVSGRAFDIEGFTDLLGKHQLRGYLYSILGNLPASQPFPPDLVRRLEPFYMRQRARNEQTVRELKLLSSAFSQARQEFILLKGPYLAKRFYGGLDRRIYWDIDILVKREELGRAQQLLTRNGFSRQSRILFNEQLTIYFSHALEFAKPGVAVDLHWALKNRPSYNFNYEDVWETKQEFFLDDVAFHVLSDQYALVLTLVSIFNDIEVGKIRIKSFVDLYMTMRALHGEVDWDRFLEDRKTEHVFKISINMLNLLLCLFDCYQEFPDLARAIDRRKGVLELLDSDTIETLMAHSRVGMTRRMWASRLYEKSRLRFLLWWMISMPFRRAAFRAGKSSRLKRDLRGLKRGMGLKD